MNWLRRLRGALGMGATWAVGWALTGLLIGVSSKLLPFLPWDAVFRVFDAPLPALALPGFVGGTIFSLVLGVVARNRGFSDLSMPGFVALGAVGGVLLSLVPATLAAVGLATINPEIGVWQLTTWIGVPLTLMSAASAGGTLAIARRAEAKELPQPSDQPQVSAR